MCRVSVVIPYFNREKTIEMAIQSVLDQEFKDYEIILVNDGSTDKSEEIVNGIIKHNYKKSIRNINQNNSGAAMARNAGINISNGEYIAFLDSDDTWDKKKLSIQVEFLDKNKEFDILGTDYIINNDNNSIIKSKNTGKFIEANFDKMIFKNFFIMPSVIVRKKIFFEENIYFDNGKMRAEDQLLFLRIMKSHRGGKIETPLISIYKYQAGVSGLSGNLILLEKDEIDNFIKLYKNKEINILILISAIIFALIKFVRRFTICKIRSLLS